jgi:hypothetical protein
LDLDLAFAFACVEKLYYILGVLKLKNKDEHAIILKILRIRIEILAATYQISISYHIKAEFQMNDNSLLQKSTKTFFAPFMIKFLFYFYF